MMPSGSLAREFAHEVQTTRRFLERLPDDRLDWRPHAKSSSLAALAAHLVDCMRWTEAIFTAAELDLDPATYRPCQAGSRAELLAIFGADARRCGALLRSVTDEELSRPWRLKVKGRQLFERSKAAAFRDMTLSHLIHHRGQLSVYLRLLDVPVPGAYGPTADESS